MHKITFVWCSGMKRFGWGAREAWEQKQLVKKATDNEMQNQPLQLFLQWWLSCGHCAILSATGRSLKGGQRRQGAGGWSRWKGQWFMGFCATREAGERGRVQAVRDKWRSDGRRVAGSHKESWAVGISSVLSSTISKDEQRLKAAGAAGAAAQEKSLVPCAHYVRREGVSALIQV